MRSSPGYPAFAPLIFATIFSQFLSTSSLLSQMGTCGQAQHQMSGRAQLPPSNTSEKLQKNVLKEHQFRRILDLALLFGDFYIKYQS